MNLCDSAGRRHRDDAVSALDLTVRPPKRFPQPGDRHRLAVAAGDGVPLSRLADRSLLEVLGRRHDRAAVSECICEHGKLGDGFCAGVDRARRAVEVDCRVRQEPPRQPVEMSLARSGVQPYHLSGSARTYLRSAIEAALIPVRRSRRI
jgi:hypothetical protein